MFGFLLGCAVGLIVGWNFIPQPEWMKKKIEIILKK